MEKLEFNGLPLGVVIQIGDVLLVGTQTKSPKEEKESA